MPSALFVTTVDSTLEAFLLPFARHLRERGWTVDALASGVNGNERLAEAFDNRFEVLWSRNPLALGNVLGTARFIRKVVSEGHYDIVWVHTPIAAFVTRSALRFRSATGPAVIYTAHGFHFHKGGNLFTNIVFYLLERAAARWTDDIVAINHADFEAAREFGTIRKRNVHLIRGIGVDVHLYEPGTVPARTRQKVRKELGAGKDDVLFTMVAEFTPNKRHGLALQALTRVGDQHVKLALVGSGPLLDRVRTEVAQLGLSGRVTLVGHRTDMPAVLAATDVLLLCSKREGLNRSGLEAMASSVPIVGTPTRGIADLISHDEYGWKSHDSTPKSLAIAMAEAARDRAERQRRGIAARVRAHEEYSLEDVIAAYDTLFDTVLARRARIPDPTGVTL